MVNNKPSATCNNLAIATGTCCPLPGIGRPDLCAIFCDRVDQLDPPMFDALTMILALCDCYVDARTPNERRRIVDAIRSEAEGGIKTHNAEVSGRAGAAGEGRALPTCYPAKK